MINASTVLEILKPWGHERVFCNVNEPGVSYCGKILSFTGESSDDPLTQLTQNSTSWHYHKKKDEVLTLINGEGLLLFSDCDSLHHTESGPILKVSTIMRTKLIKDIPVRIKPGVRHLILSLSGLLILEHSSFHDDKDTVRLKFVGLS
jgi:hypothetical protein